MIKKSHLTILLFILIRFTIQGQTLPKEFGENTMAEMELKQYTENKDAEAIVLYDFGKSYFVQIGNSFELVFERKTRIKILTEAGIKWAKVEIPYYQEGNIYEKVYDIEAYSYNFENGTIYKTPLNLSNTYDEVINKNWNLKKFVFPNVKEGTMIEYKYKISSQYKFNLRDWEFQWKIPVIYSEYKVSLIPFYEYIFLLQGADKFDSQTSFIDKVSLRKYGRYSIEDMVHTFTMKDIPAFENEEFITSIKDYIIKIDFQLSKINNPKGHVQEIVTTWEAMNKDLLNHADFGKCAKKSEKLASKLLDTKSLTLNNDKEMFDHVIQYVKRNYNWDKDNSKYSSKSPDKFVKDKYGNCADINLFTIGLLNACGIEAKPVVISTRENGKIKHDYPFTHFFNYVIILAIVDGVNVLTDATEILNLNDRIPTRCINDIGLIVQKDKVEWINLECTVPSELKTDIQIEVINNEIINSTVTNTATEYNALSYRNNYGDKIETIKEKIESKEYTINVPSIVVQNQLDIEKPYVLSYKQTSKPEIVNEKIYLSPMLSEVISENPLKQKERTYPIDMTYPSKRIFKSTILIPEGYKVDYLPSERKISNILFDLTYSINSDDNQIIISMDYYFKKAVYPPYNYSIIKTCFDEIVNKGNEKIVFAKK